MKAPSPRKGGHLGVLVHRVKPVAGVELLSERGADVGVGAMVQKKMGERGHLGLMIVVHPEVRLRNHGGEKRRMTPEPGPVHGGLRVDVRAALDQPSGHLHLVIVDTHVQQSRTRKRGPMRGQNLVVATQVRGVDLLVRECPIEDRRVSPRLGFEQVDTPSMHRLDII